MYFDISGNIVDRQKSQAYIRPMSITIEKAADCLDALGNPTRLTIFRMLTRAGVEGKAVGKIQEELEIPASTLTHHLKHLELVGLVTRAKQGTTHYCTATYAGMDDLVLFLTENCCAEGSGTEDGIHLAHKIQA